jgi:hypothetical protein
LTSLSEKLVAKIGLGKDFDPERMCDSLRERGVSMTAELGRILALPRRSSDFETQGYAPGGPRDLTPLYSKGVAQCAVVRDGGDCPVCRCGPPTLWTIQSAMLWEASEQNGLLGEVAVGAGKTLVTLLLHDAMNAVRTVLLVGASLRPQLIEEDLPAYGRHFHLPPYRAVIADPPLPGLYIVAYSDLSNAKKGDVLNRITPDLIIPDEAHRLRNRQSSRTQRYYRYLEAHPECRTAPLSGSTTKRSIKDAAPLAEAALKKNSPFPRTHGDLRDWAAALDPDNPRPMQPGKLLLLCAEGEPVLSGFRRRRVETAGVVATTASALDTSLLVEARELTLAPSVAAALDYLEKYWAWEGEEIEDGMAFARISRQLACGFYYRWVWPGGTPDDDDRAWLAARAAWHKDVREMLARSAQEGFDSPLLLWNAAARGDWQPASWAPWASVRDRYRPHPPVEAVWLDDFFIKDVGLWVAKQQQRAAVSDGGAIVWTVHAEVGKQLSERLRLPYYGEGRAAAEALTVAHPRNAPVIICSQLAHGTGRNLQAYDANLVTTCPANAPDIEQLIGRTHRPGQRADEVHVTVHQHTEALRRGYWQAYRDAVFIEQSQGQRQKLLYANRIGFGVARPATVPEINGATAPSKRA